MTHRITSEPLWRIYLLGGLRAERPAESITRFRTQKIAALLAYLALFPRRSHPREELAELFWPDVDPEAGRMNLRTALSSLRKQLEPPGVPAGCVIKADGKSFISLNADAVWIDVAQLEDALKRESLEEAIQLYGGPLLPGFYDSWAVTERERLSECYLRAAHALIGQYEQAGRIPQALDLARRAVSADPLREEAHTNVIRLLHLSGEPAAAFRQYQELERILDRELGLQPSAEALELARQGVAPVRKAQSARPQTVDASPGAEDSAIEAARPPRGDGAVTAPRPPVNLPAALTRFFGREEEIDQVRSMLCEPDVRLVTLTGPGGSGKTRLSIEVAQRMADDCPGGVWFVPLSDLRDAERIPDLIAQALGIPASATAMPMEQVTARLTDVQAPTLLVLDNFEQLAEDGAVAVHDLLMRVPTVKCLVSSRQRLPLGAQREFPVLPLPLPEQGAAPQELMGSPSVQLFVNRAQAARPDFQLRDQNAEAITAICSRLEGIPLALELAAGWAQTLTPAQMLGRLERRLDLLVSRRRDLPGRHATLRVAIEWSYQLLPPPIQQFFADLSVFHGGWTLEAAEAIANEPNALEYIARLEEHSLIIAAEEPHEAAGAGMRFRMLETLREFAAELLAEDPGLTEEVSSRHFDYFLRLAQASMPKLRGPEQVHWLRRLDLEYSNMNAALSWSLSDQRSAEKTLRLACALGQFWLMGGPWEEARTWLERGLELDVEISPEIRCAALLTAGQIAWRTQDRESAQFFCTQGFTLSRELGDNWSAALCLCILGRAGHHGGDYVEARNLLEKAVRLARTVDDWWLLGQALCSLGNILLPQGEGERGRACFEEALALSRSHGDKHGIANTLRGLANLLRAIDAGVPIEPLIQESITLFNELGDTNTVAFATMVLGFIAYDKGDFPSARAHYDTALRLSRQSGDRYCSAHALHNRAHAFLLERNLEGARADFVQSLSLFRGLDHSGDVALSLEGFAGLAVAEQSWARVAHLYGASEALREATGMPLAPLHHARRDAELEIARNALGDTAFTVAREEGRAMSRDQAVAFALEMDRTP
jgi:predicted ATPase/DNA-binding SARP family transcriptional activator